VFLKIQPYVQQFVMRRSNKLSYKYFGPYLITQRVGKVAYRLQLPASSQIHPVVHVSQMKKAMPPETAVNSDETLLQLAPEQPLQPTKVIKTKLQLIGTTATPFALVH
jgi:hypothetical protein